MTRLLVNDMLSALPDHTTFWNNLQEWFDMTFVGGDYATLHDKAWDHSEGASLIIRNCSYFPPIVASSSTPTISLLQDIITQGPQRDMQEKVLESSSAVVFNSQFTLSKYYESITWNIIPSRMPVIPLPVDFSVFELGNPMGLQQVMSLPDKCVCWVGACQEAGHIKGWDVFIRLARINPDINFVAVLKDGTPESIPPNVRYYVKLPHDELVKVIGACRMGLCTSRMESQHLAGIEMGACGLPLVTMPVGTYYQRADMPGIVLAEDADFGQMTNAIRFVLSQPGDAEKIREYWKVDFDVPVIKEQWIKLVEEVEKT